MCFEVELCACFESQFIVHDLEESRISAIQGQYVRAQSIIGNGDIRQLNGSRGAGVLWQGRCGVLQRHRCRSFVNVSDVERKRGGRVGISTDRHVIDFHVDCVGLLSLKIQNHSGFQTEFAGDNFKAGCIRSGQRQHVGSLGIIGHGNRRKCCGTCSTHVLPQVGGRRCQDQRGSWIVNRVNGDISRNWENGRKTEVVLSQHSQRGDCIAVGIRGRSPVGVACGVDFVIRADYELGGRESTHANLQASAGNSLHDECVDRTVHIGFIALSQEFCERQFDLRILIRGIDDRREGRQLRP